MKILFISHYTALYGANRSLLTLIDGLRDKIEPMVVLPEKGPLSDALESRGIPVHITAFYSWIYRDWRRWIKIPSRMLNNFQATTALKPIITEFKPELIYSNSSVIGLGFLLSKRFRLPHIMHIREFIKAHYSMQYDLEPIGMDYIYNHIHAVIAVSNAIATGLLQNVDSHRKHVIYNGIVSKNVQSANPKILKPGTVTFGIIGLLSEGKRIEEMIAAFKVYHQQHPDARLLIVGDNEQEHYKAALKAQAGRLLEAGHIEFMGYINEMQTIYPQIDVHVICSASDALSRVPIEAMAYGIPSIGFRGGGTPEIIEDQKNG